MKPRFVFTVVFVLLTGSSLSAQTQAVRWAGNVDILVPNVLHAPDDRNVGVNPAPTLSQFSPTFRYSRLSSLLRVSDRDWARADVIAFEGNGGHGAGPEAGWESSVWTFTDGTNTFVVRFNELVGRSSHPSVVANGSIIGTDGTISSGGDAYRSFFGICTPNPQNKVVSFILFDLDGARPPINVASPNFKVKIQGRSGFGEGTPDPDAVGVISRCP